MSITGLWRDLEHLLKTWRIEAGNPAIDKPDFVRGVVWGIQQAMNVVKKHIGGHA